MIEFPLIGREGPLAALRRALRAAADGSGGCVVVEGPAGIGKSRIVSVAASEAVGLNMAVAMGRASELDRAAPLQSLMTAFQRSRPGFTVGSHGMPEGTRFWLIDRIGALIEDHARERPLVVVLDDAQWADELTALALRVLIPASSSPVLWLLARRPVPTRSPAQDAIDWLLREGATRLPLGPLSDEAVANLCTIVLGAKPDSTVLDLARRCAGNPFLLEQLLRTLPDAGQVLIVDGVATAVVGQLPSSFLTAVDERLRDLSSYARRLLEAGSVFGRPFTVHEASGLVGCSAVELVPAATEAIEAGFLVESEAELTFRHDLIREAVYNSLSRPVRLALHREAANVVQAEGRSPVEVTEHLVHSGRKGDEQAVAVLRDAVAQVAPDAPGTAAGLILRMLDLLGENDPARPRLVADAVRLLAAAGRVAEARELGEAALRAGLGPEEEAALLLGLAEALKHAGHNAAVVEYTRRALAVPGVPDIARARLLAIQAHGLLFIDIDAADVAGAEAATVGAATGEHAALVFGTVARSIVARLRGHFDEAAMHAYAAVQVADTAGGEARHRHPRLWLARALAAADRFDEADSMYATGQREADQLGTAWSQPLWHYYRAELRMAAGRLDDARAEAAAGVRVAEQLGALQLSVPLLALLARVAIRRDDVVAARRYLRKTQQLLADGVSVGPGNVTWAVARLQEAMGQADAAIATLGDVYDGFPLRMMLLADEPEAGPALVRIAQCAGATKKAEATAAAARVLADRNPSVASLAGAAAHAEGLLTADAALLRKAVNYFASSPRLLARASALEDLAVVARADLDTAEMVGLLEEALDLYTTRGARRDAARAQRLLRSLGVRRRARFDAGQNSPWNGLTQSEMRVVRLVAEGLTNREVADQLFLSAHTVDSHLRHVFTKLGIQSRVELTRQFLARGPDGSDLVDPVHTTDFVG